MPLGLCGVLIMSMRVRGVMAAFTAPASNFMSAPRRTCTGLPPNSSTVGA